MIHSLIWVGAVLSLCALAGILWNAKYESSSTLSTFRRDAKAVLYIFGTVAFAAALTGGTVGFLTFLFPAMVMFGAAVSFGKRPKFMD